nr:MAG TPA: hypothetical protein [Caudoviricetes sp.]DAO71791.1 MAG TPA: hypothetical protein [Caudoviricetes sp.]
MIIQSRLAYIFTLVITLGFQNKLYLFVGRTRGDIIFIQSLCVTMSLSLSQS